MNSKHNEIYSLLQDNLKDTPIVLEEAHIDDLKAPFFVLDLYKVQHIYGSGRVIFSIPIPEISLFSKDSNIYSIWENLIEVLNKNGYVLTNPKRSYNRDRDLYVTTSNINI